MQSDRRRDRIGGWLSRNTGVSPANLSPSRPASTSSERQSAILGQQPVVSSAPREQPTAIGGIAPNPTPTCQPDPSSVASPAAPEDLRPVTDGAPQVPSAVSPIPSSPPPPYCSPPSSVASSVPSSPSILSCPSPSSQRPPVSDILRKALAKLDFSQQETISAHLEPDEDAISRAVDKLCSVVGDKKAQCEANPTWTIQYRGETVLLRDKADKILLLCNRLKEVGDIAVSADPIHAGLPWAGIRLMLEVVTAGKEQMSFLLDGFEVALYMTNRLKAYLEYLADLPPNQATDNFEVALVNFYAFILKFFADSIAIYQKNTIVRFLQAFANKCRGNDFRIECEEHERRTEADASICERFVSQTDRHIGKKLYDDFRAALVEIQDIRNVSGSLDKLHEKIDLMDLRPVVGAAFDSYAIEDTTMCLANTRVDLLKQIMEWTDDSQGSCIYWLKGMAGTGKSTIARTVADMLDKRKCLGASFFFKRGEADRSSAGRFFPTLAYQMAARIPKLGKEIAKSLESNSGVCDKILREQFDKLLMNPLKETLVRRSAQKTWVVVLDALDECDSDRDIRTLIKLLAEVKDVSSYTLRIFTTSRPELPVRLGFQSVSGTAHKDVVLEDITASTVTGDITVFLEDQFVKIKAESEASLPDDWPGDDNLRKLASMASPLFIYAATICRFISDPSWDASDQLDIIFQEPERANMSQLARTYAPVLGRLLQDQTKTQKAKIAAGFRQVVGTIMLVFEPQSVSCLSTLLAVNIKEVRLRLNQLHSVINISSSDDTPVRLLHLSFRDFLLDEDQCDQAELRIDRQLTHGELVDRCLEIASAVLKRDICGINEPGFRRQDLKIQAVTVSLPAAASYACRYWVAHLDASGHRIVDRDNVSIFLREKFLFWIEALSWLGEIYTAKSLIDTLEACLHPTDGSTTALFLKDAQRWIAQSRRAIDIAPLQAYVSALAFAPSQIVMRSYFQQQALKKVDVGNGSSDWPSGVLTLDGHERRVNSIAYSPDGRLLASSSDDSTMRLWKLATGQEIWKLPFPNGVSIVAFSPSGRWLAILSDKLEVWDHATGQCHISKHTGRVTDLGFLSEGLLLYTVYGGSGWRCLNIAREIEVRKTGVWALIDDKVGVSDVESGLAQIYWASKIEPGDETFESGADQDSSESQAQEPPWWARDYEVPRLETHKRRVTRFAVSPKAELLARADENGVDVLEFSTRSKVTRLGAASARSIRFSADSSVVSIYADRRVSLWDVRTSKKIDRLDNGLDFHSAAFSPDGVTIALGTDAGTIMLQDLYISPQGKVKPSASCGTEIETMTMCLDGRTLATGSWRGELCLWNIETGTVVSQWLDLPGVTALAFAPTGDMLASGVFDGTVTIWNTMQGVEKVNSIRTRISQVDRLALSSQGNYLACQLGPTVAIWRVADASKTMTYHIPFFATTLAFSPYADVLAVTLHESVQFFNLADDSMSSPIAAGQPASNFRFLQDNDRPAVLERLSDTTTGERVRANLGSTEVQIAIEPRRLGISTDNQWVQEDGADVIWIPPEHRPNSAKLWASNDRTVAIAKGSAVHFITV